MAAVVIESWNGFGGDTTQVRRRWKNANLSTTRVKTGTHAQYGGAGNAAERLSLIFGSQTIYFGLWVYWTGAVPNNGAIMLCNFANGFDGFSRAIALTFNTSHQIAVLNGGGSTMGTSAACLTTNAWNYVAAKAVIAIAGSVDVYCNTLVTPVVTVSGDTRGAFYGDSIKSVYLGGQADGTYAVGPLWVFDSTGSANNALPTTKLIVTAFHPSTGNGANTGMTPSTGTDHGALVDEAIANDDTDYVSGTAGQKDTYLYATSALAGFDVPAVQVVACVKPTVAGTNTWAGVTRIGGADSDGATKTIAGTAYELTEQIWDRRPSDGAAWTQPDATEFGGKVVATAGAIRLTKHYLELLTTETVTVPPAVATAQAYVWGPL